MQRSLLSGARTPLCAAVGVATVFGVGLLGGSSLEPSTTAAPSMVRVVTRVERANAPIALAPVVAARQVAAPLAVAADPLMETHPIGCDHGAGGHLAAPDVERAQARGRDV